MSFNVPSISNQSMILQQLSHDWMQHYQEKQKRNETQVWVTAAPQAVGHSLTKKQRKFTLTKFSSLAICQKKFLWVITCAASAGWARFALLTPLPQGASGMAILANYLKYWHNEIWLQGNFLKVTKERVTRAKLYHEPTVYFFISLKDQEGTQQKMWCKKVCLDAAGTAGFFFPWAVLFSWQTANALCLSESLNASHICSSRISLG